MILTLCLESEQHTADQNTTFSAVSFQECFFCIAFWRKHCFLQWFWCLHWILHYIVVHITIYIYIYRHYLTNLLELFTIVYVSRKICIWYWTDMSAISSCKVCIFWNVFCILSCCSWVLFKKEHVQIEHARLQKMV